MKPPFLAFLVLVLSTLDSQFSILLAQGTAITYQGRLNDANGPANGSYDLAFTLFNTNVSGGSVAGPVVKSSTMVSNGLFTVLIDFGTGVFTGNSNWLEIAVQTNGGNGFTTLTPRQRLTPVPYAITAGNISGIIPLTQLPGGVVTNGANGVNIAAPSSNTVALTVSNILSINGGAIVLGTNHNGSEGGSMYFDAQPLVDRNELNGLQGGQQGIYWASNMAAFGSGAIVGQLYVAYGHVGSPGNVELNLISSGGMHLKAGLGQGAGNPGVIVLGDQITPTPEVAIERAGGDGGSGLLAFDTVQNGQGYAITGPGFRAQADPIGGWSYLSLFNPSPTAGGLSWSAGGGIEQMRWSTNGTRVLQPLTIDRKVLMPTNYVAANFTPVAGMGIMVCSNGFLYWVTQQHTNLIVGGP